MASRSRILQNVLLVWLETSRKEAQSDFHNSLEHVQHTIDSIHKFTDVDECVDYISDVMEEKIFLIVSGSLGRRIISEIHDIEVLDSIYIFCSNPAYHKSWSDQWPKIKGVHADIQSICENLRKNRIRCDQDAIPISYIGINPSFMYTQLLKEALIDMVDQSQEDELQTLVLYCRKQGTINETQIAQLQERYRAENAIWWYTSNSFLYWMLNRALRELDVDTILPMQFFIRDLHQQLQQLHRHQNFLKEPFTVYRGQGLSRQNFKRLQNTGNGLISFNSFLSTSLNENVSLQYAESSADEPENVGVLFVMHIDPTGCRSVPFVQLDHKLAQFPVEEEVLFSTHTVFRVDQIEPIRDNQTKTLWRARLSLTDENDKELNQLSKQFREDLGNARGSSRLAAILIKVEHFQKAAEIYETLSGSIENQSDAEHNLHNLGYVYWNIGEYSRALEFYGQSLGMREKRLPTNHPALATSYNNIAAVHSKMGEYSKALEFYEKARGIREESLGVDDPFLADSYNNTGFMYSKMGEYLKALHFYQKARIIFEKILPLNHPSLAASYNNIAGVFLDMREYAKALEFFEKAYVIRKRVCL